MTKEEFITEFINTVEGLQKELNEGNIDVYEFYNEMVMLKDYINSNLK